MKNIFFFCLLLVSGFTTTAQNKTDTKALLGTWKIIAIGAEEGQVYIDLVNDSTFISDSLKKDWTSKEDSMMSMGALKFLVEVIEIEHHENLPSEVANEHAKVGCFGFIKFDENSYQFDCQSRRYVSGLEISL